MTLRNLEIFTAVADHGNMTRAAKALFISQSSISQCIAEIEQKYGVLLFERLSSGLRLTQTGEGLVHHARSLLLAEKAVEDFLSHESRNLRLRIGATATVGACIISGIVAEMQKRIPDIDQRIHVANTSAIEEMILKNELDIALIEGNVKSPDIVAKAATGDRLVLICSSKHPFCKRDSIRVEELDGVPLILREVGSGTRAHCEEILQLGGISPDIRFDCISFDAILDAVENNLGVSLISERLATKWAEKGDFHVCDIKGAEIDRNFRLIHHKNKYFTEPLHLFAVVCSNTDYHQYMLES